MKTLLFVINYITETLFPRTCSGCGSHGSHLCERCLAYAQQSDRPREPFISAVFDYGNKGIRGAIWKFKYKNARGIAKAFGAILYEEIIGDLGDSLHISPSEKFLLVPIPLHTKRFRERGYNQSELLAREIVRHDTENIFELAPNALIRTRATNAQAKKEKREARFVNLRGAFVANAKLVYRRNIILVDDVTTTGATLAEARKMLKKAGAREVRAWAVAH